MAVVKMSATVKEADAAQEPFRTLTRCCGNVEKHCAQLAWR